MGAPAVLDLEGELTSLQGLLARVRARWRSAVAAGDPVAVEQAESIEWYLDNHYQAELALQDVRRDVPRRFYRQLPRADSGLPRVYEVAIGLLDQGELHCSLPELTAFLDDYQEHSPLTLGEVWALPSVLRIGLLQQLADTVGRLAGAIAEGFVTPGTPRGWGSRLRTPSADVVARCLTSLKALRALDWEPTAERISVIHRILTDGDPVGVYARMDYDSRDRYRRIVEEVARRSSRSEAEVARAAVRLAGTPGGGAPALSERRRHVGYFLADAGIAELEQLVGSHPALATRLRRGLVRRATGTYLGTFAVTTAAVVLAAATYALPGGPWISLVAGLLAVVPGATAGVAFVNWLVTKVMTPQVLPKLDFSDGLPADQRCLVVIPGLIGAPGDVDGLLRQLQAHFARNPDPALAFAVLSDFADAPTPTLPADDGLLEYAGRALVSMNAATPGEPFLFLHRRRQFNPTQGCWMGWERKRGKLHELDRLLAGDPGTSFEFVVGDRRRLVGVRYVITLDADTVLSPDGAARLVGALAHPLNRPVFDPVSGRVIAGYTILQPRAEIDPDSAGRSWYTRVFSGDATVDLYSRAVSDAYQDLFGDGVYVGKGIYDVVAFEHSLAGKVPENSLLSHDLVEGIQGRVGLVTDITVYEEHPPNFLVGEQRLHRWIRGDWQLLPWLGRHGPAGGGRTHWRAIDRWKVVDNLRRSVVAPANTALLLVSWLVLPGPGWVWTALALLTPALQVLGGLLGAAVAGVGVLVDRRRAGPWLSRLVQLRLVVARWLMFAGSLGIDTLLSLDAIARSLWRVYRSRRNLLEWTTAAGATRLIGPDLSVRLAVRSTFPSVLAAVLLGVLVALVRPAALPAAVPFLGLWVAAPWLVVWVSRPRPPVVARPLNAAQRRAFGALARRTWLFFERFVGPDDNWLPPDNVQEQPLGVVAHRTSPTNVGLYLLSCLVAHDRGYLSTPVLASRLTWAFDSLDRVERYRGHLPNWFDTTDLRPLRPAYVSTVDSGNLAAALVIVAQACEDARGLPVDPRRSWQGLADTVHLVGEGLRAIRGGSAQTVRGDLDDLGRRLSGLAAGRPEDPVAVVTALEHLPARIADLAHGEGRPDAEALATIALHTSLISGHLNDRRRVAAQYTPWIAVLPAAPAEVTGAGGGAAVAWEALGAEAATPVTWAELPAHAHRIAALLNRLRAALPSPDSAADDPGRQWVSRLLADTEAAVAHARQLVDALDAQAARARHLLADLDFTFLYHPTRGVFHIGYNLDGAALDASYYDLLASEARIASLVAIGRHQVPQRHWLHLARPMTRTATGDHALLSWSGTMFEYLLPTLVAEAPPASLLGRSCRAVVAHQIAYGKRSGVPWGISESGFYAFDAHRNYQYRAFGVPGLGLQRQVPDDLVIAPYASLMATHLDPDAVEQNLQQFRSLGAVGPYGAYEAIDFTPARVPLGRTHAVVRSHMAHHQGMILAALGQALDGPELVRRFHAEPFTAAVSLLLREEPPILPPEPVAAELPAVVTDSATSPRPSTPWAGSRPDHLPGVHWLSNGSLSVLLTDAGGGYVSRNGTALTRWRADGVLQSSGCWLYVRDHADGQVWSATQRPCGRGAEPGLFHAAKAEYRAVNDGIRSDVQVAVAAEDDVEIRRIELANETDRPRTLSVSAFAEVVLTDLAGDERHPAFGKLFVEADSLPDDLAGVSFRRRPGGPGGSPDAPPGAVVFSLVIDSAEDVAGTRFGRLLRCTNREEFLGRLRGPDVPIALDAGGWWDGSGPGEVDRAPLDPAAALSQVVELGPRSRARLALVTAAADTLEAATDLVRRYRSWPTVDHVLAAAPARADHELRVLGFDADDLSLVERLLSHVLLPGAAFAWSPDWPPPPGPLLPALWGLGISGDLPLVSVHVAGEADLHLVEELLRAHLYWRRRGVAVDLALVDEGASGYAEGMRGQFHRLFQRWEAQTVINARGGVFPLAADQLGEQGRAALHLASRVVFPAGLGGLAERLDRVPQAPVPLPALDPERADAPTEPTWPVQATRLDFDNGVGGFVPDSGDYLIRVSPGRGTPAPWSNVIATPEFGFLCTESGFGATWAGNSGENRLTPWRNDPLVDLPAEAVYLRDEESGRVWSATPQPCGAPVDYQVRHAPGRTVYSHHADGLSVELHAFAAPGDPVKLVRLVVADASGRPRRLTVTYYAEWVLGVHPDATRHGLVAGYDTTAELLTARNPLSQDHPGQVAFLGSDRPVHGWTTDRLEFLGREGGLARPAALGRIGLARASGPGLDPCGALQVHLDLAPAGEEAVTFVLGAGEGIEHARDVAERFRAAEAPARADREVGALWDDLLGAVQVQTPDPAFDLLVNRWLPYQTVAGRLWGRTGYHQSSGAFGFRDQLQDILLLLWSRPDLAREHLLRAAAHQFAEGDVLHWWHPPLGRGVRTQISDDLLWLPYVTARYVESTGDADVLAEPVAFLRGATLGPRERERYDLYPAGDEVGDLLEHCRRAVRRGLTAGAHGLPLIGAGDWNDGMNRVGSQGRGESVWLGWFAFAAVHDLAALCDTAGHADEAREWRERAEALRRAVEAHAWDGAWYLRAFYDDGTPLGSALNSECRIDSIAQSWAVLSGASVGERAAQAVRSAVEQLVRDDDRLVLLFTPPFDRSAEDPGYIRGYLPGVRENGGQYTHGASWLAWAAAALGDGDTAVRLVGLLNPIRHTATPQAVAHYRGEPYVLAGDVYAGRHPGRSGWTWYTGSSAWLYRTCVEGVLGLRRRGDQVEVTPRLPADWPGFRATVRRGGTAHRIVVERAADGSLTVEIEPTS